MRHQIREVLGNAQSKTEVEGHGFFARLLEREAQKWLQERKGEAAYVNQLLSTMRTAFAASRSSIKSGQLQPQVCGAGGREGCTRLRAWVMIDGRRQCSCNDQV